jgi:hypothetical protein
MLSKTLLTTPESIPQVTSKFKHISDYIKRAEKLQLTKNDFDGNDAAFLTVEAAGAIEGGLAADPNMGAAGGP